MSLPVAEAYQQKFYNWANKQYGYSKNNMNADPILYSNTYEKFKQATPLTLEERQKMHNELYYRTKAGQSKKVLNNAANATRAAIAANTARKIAEFEKKAANLKRAANERAVAKAVAKAAAKAVAKAEAKAEANAAVVVNQNAHVKANKALRAAYNTIKNRKVSNLSLRDPETLQPRKNSRSTASFASASELPPNDMAGGKRTRHSNRTKRLRRRS